MRSEFALFGHTAESDVARTCICIFNEFDSLSGTFSSLFSQVLGVIQVISNDSRLVNCHERAQLDANV